MESADTAQSRDETTTRAEDKRSNSEMPASEGKRSQRKRKPGEQATPHKVIEKRRRDRINHSLDELRAILPASKRSQGVRNDKVDLLQMTIDHLKELQEANKGSKNGSQDPQRMGNGVENVHDVGFNECIQEARRFLVEEEDVDPSDPLIVRLIGHLESQAKHRCNSAVSDDDPQSPVKRVVAEETVYTEALDPPVAKAAALNLSAGVDPMQGMNGLELISSVAESSRLTTSSLQETLQSLQSVKMTVANAIVATVAAATPQSVGAISSVAGTYQGLPIYLPVNMIPSQGQAVATTTTATNNIVASTAPAISPIPIALIANAAIGTSQTTQELPLAVVSQAQPSVPATHVTPKLSQPNYYAYWGQPYVANAWK